MDNTVDNKTLAMGTQALVHHGGLLERIGADKPFLPGNIIMVPRDVWAVLTAGGQATTLFEEGLHELDLMMFNRRPSGIMYLVHKHPHQAVWAAPGGQNPLEVVVQCNDPKSLVQLVALDRELDSEQEVWSLVFNFLSDAVHAQVQPSEARRIFESALGTIGLNLVALTQGPKEKATVQIRKPQVQALGHREPSQGTLALTHVMAGSTMKAYGSGKLSIVARLRAALTEDRANQGDFIYDRTVRFDVPEGWIRTDQWLELPEGQLSFHALDRNWVAVLELVAEPRDTTQSQPLGSVTTPLTLAPGEFELGTPQGGKKEHFIRVKGRFSLPVIH